MKYKYPKYYIAFISDNFKFENEKHYKDAVDIVYIPNNLMIYGINSKLNKLKNHYYVSNIDKGILKNATIKALKRAFTSDRALDKESIIQYLNEFFIDENISNKELEKLTIIEYIERTLELFSFFDKIIDDNI